MNFHSVFVMVVERITSPGIAHNSYLIGSDGVAAVIDPRRDCDQYMDFARDHDMQITHIFETHRNEDFCIGSLELAYRCGAAIYHGEKTPFGYGHAARDGDHFTFGKLDLEVLETPGHTAESISFALRDAEGGERVLMVFTGDALFAGDVGRTDLMGIPREESAALIHDSIMEKILPSGDGAIVCPAHGSGSVCGSLIAGREYTTIGYEKTANPLLRLDRDSFIARVSKEQYYIPPYFAKMEVLNLSGPPILHRLPDITPFSPSEVDRLRHGGAQILDIRSPTSFAGGHIPGSLSIWREGLGAYMGWFLAYETPIILITDFNLALDEVVRDVIRLGYDNITGYLAGGFPAWFKAGKPQTRSDVWSVQELHDRVADSSLFLLDVRDIHNRMKVGEIAGSHPIFVGELPGRLADVPRDRQVIVYCDSGYKGSLAVSVLTRNGYTRVANLLGGMTGWIRAGYPAEPAG